MEKNPVKKTFQNQTQSCFNSQCGFLPLILFYLLCPRGNHSIWWGTRIFPCQRENFFSRQMNLWFKLRLKQYLVIVLVMASITNDTERLKTTKMYCLTVLETRNPKVKVGKVGSSWGFEEASFLASSSFSGSRSPLACGCIYHSNLCIFHMAFSSLFCLLLFASLIRTLVFSGRDTPVQDKLIWIIFIMPAKTVFSNKVTRPNIHSQTLGGHIFWGFTIHSNTVVFFFLLFTLQG